MPDKLLDKVAFDELVTSLVSEDWCASLRAEEMLVRAGAPVVEELVSRLALVSRPPSAVLRVIVRIGPAAARTVCRALESGRLAPSREMTRALCEIGDPESVTAYVRLAAHEDMAIRTAAAAGLAALGNGALPSLYKASMDRSALIRAAAIPLLANRATPEALRALEAGLEDSAIEVRKAAISACLASGKDELVRAVCRTLAASDLQARVNAAAALLAEVEALPETVRQVLDTLESPQQRDAVSEVLCDYLNLNGALEYILEKASPIRASSLLMRKLMYPKLRVRAQEGLRRLATYPVDPLVDLLGSPLPEVRASAVELLILAGERAVPALIQRGLQSPQSAPTRVRFEAKAALAGIGDPAAAALVKRYAGFSGTLQAEVVVLFGRLGSTRAVQLLVSALGENDTAVTAAASLQQIAERSGDPVLRQAIPELRRRARPWSVGAENFRIALEAIEAATKGHASLPLVADRKLHPADLPLPARSKSAPVNLPQVPASDSD